MEQRLDFVQADPEALKAMLGIGKYVHNSGLEQSLIDLIEIRASQINRCAYCLDMHVKDATVSGETQQRLHGVSVWRETPYFTDRERAAFEWTEALTVLTDGFVPDEVYDAVRQQFTEAELVALTMAVNSINAWNRLNVSFRRIPGGYVSQRKPATAQSPEPALG